MITCDKCISDGRCLVKSDAMDCTVFVRDINKLKEKNE